MAERGPAGTPWMMRLREKSTLDSIPHPPGPARAARERASLDLWHLQRLAGNTAVTELIAQRDAAPAPTLPADAPVRQPAPAAAPADATKVLPPPAPVRGIPVSEEEGPHGGVDVAADAKNVTISIVYKDWNFPKSEDGALIDWLHEPNVSIQFDPKNLSPAVIQAAIAAMNVHLRRHARDLVELSISPQVSVPTGDDPSSPTVGPTVGIQGQAELHVTATFSITMSSAVSAGKSRATGGATIQWDPQVMVGVLFHLEKEKAEAPKRSDQVDDTIGWIESRFDASTMDDGGADDNLKYGVDEIILRLINGMKDAGQGAASIDLDLGEHARPLPNGMETGLTQLVDLIIISHPALRALTSVRINVYRLKPGSTQRTIMRVFVITPEPPAGKPGDYPVSKAGARRA